MACLASAQDETYLYHKCSGANYTSSSAYQKNLNTLLSSLTSNNGIDYGFYNFSEGEGIERVNFIALCRGDVRQAACQRCVNFSTTDLPQRCPTQKEAIVWYDNCMFRYSNQSIFRTWEQPALYMWNLNNVSDVTKFSQSLDGLLSDLRKEASAGDSRQKFAIGDASYANYTRIYGLVQCTPDLSEVQCSNCLDRSFRDITNAFNGKQGGRVIGPSCNFRYEIDQFYEIPPPPSPPATAAPPPTTTDIVPPTGGGGNKTRTIIIAVVSTVCFVILIICIFFFLQRRKLREKLESVDEIGADA
uniref:Gnk2-homologous domain-containing protein n=1 Tax=Kalanchoe fedtschenkoi TaxID=63787 RepID=A0A7N0TRI7_KALFE